MKGPNTDHFHSLHFTHFSQLLRGVVSRTLANDDQRFAFGRQQGRRSFVRAGGFLGVKAWAQNVQD